jgi:hypothetical protein
MAYVPYVSLLDNTDGVDIIRATTTWFGQGERYDFPTSLSNDSKESHTAHILQRRWRISLYSLVLNHPIPSCPTPGRQLRR